MFLRQPACFRMRPRSGDEGAETLPRGDPRGDPRQGGDQRRGGGGDRYGGGGGGYGGGG